jgi:hypothetical protein
LRSGEHLTGLVDGLLELSRIERGKLVLESRPIALGEFLSQVVRMFQPLTEAKGVGFEYRIEGELPDWVNGDAKRLRQVLINLLSNAVKFTDTGSVTLKVRHQREIADIEVIDTGVGIAQADLQRIFNPFERLRPGGVEGTGLGLTISQLLVELLGGEIRVSSTPGSGSCFHVRIYLPVVSGPASSKEAPAEAIVGYEGPRRQILIVDDEQAHRAVLRLLLAPLGFDIIEAALGADALRAIAIKRPDLILLDVNLPDQAGWSVCKAIRHTTGSRIAILMVSGTIDSGNAERVRAHDCDGFIAKPFMQAELLEAVTRSLSLRWTTQAETGGHAVSLAPPAETLRELLALSAGGYPKALRARLAEMAQESAATAAWVAQLTPLLESNPAALNAVLIEALREGARG